MYYSRTTQYTVRVSHVILIAFLSIGLSACANPTNSSKVTPDTSSLTASPQGTSQAFRFGDPVESETNALIAAQAGLKTGFEYTEPLTIVKVEQLSYGDTIELLGASADRPPAMKVWLVIYSNDGWHAIGPSSSVTSYLPFQGCVSVLINASDGSLLETGGPLKSGIAAQCDTPQS